jgi:hypothetical protein
MEKPNTEKPARMKRCYCPVMKYDREGKIVGLTITIPNGTSVYPLYHLEEIQLGVMMYVEAGSLLYTPMKIGGP